MKNFFPATYKSFQLVNAHMAGVASKTPALPGGSVKAAASAPAAGLGLLEGQTVAERKKYLQDQIDANRQQFNDTRTQYLEKKDTYDNRWTDTWGTKKSEMDTAKAAYNFTENRARILDKQREELEAQEKAEGEKAQAANQQTFAKVDTKVETFDANAELRKGLKDTAKVYGDATAKGLGKAGEVVDKAVGGDGTIGRAAGEGIGEGTTGILTSIGDTTAGAIEGAQKKVEDTVKFTNDAIVDPTGTAKKVADGAVKKIDGAIEEGKNIVNEVATGDIDKLGKRVEDGVNAGIDMVPGARNAVTSAESVKVLATGKDFNGKEVDLETQKQKQYDAASSAIFEAGGEAAGNLLGEAKDKLTGKKPDLPGGAPKTGTPDVDAPKVSGAIPEPGKTTFNKVAEKTFDAAEKVNKVVEKVGEAGELAEEGEKGRGNGELATALDTMQGKVAENTTTEQPEVSAEETKQLEEKSTFTAPEADTTTTDDSSQTDTTAVQQQADDSSQADTTAVQQQTDDSSQADAAAAQQQAGADAAAAAEAEAQAARDAESAAAASAAADAEAEAQRARDAEAAAAASTEAPAGE